MGQDKDPRKASFKMFAIRHIKRNQFMNCDDEGGTVLLFDDLQDLLDQSNCYADHGDYEAVEVTIKPGKSHGTLVDVCEKLTADDR